MKPKKTPASATESSQKGNFELADSTNPVQTGMRVIATKTLRDFWEKHADAEQALRAWNREATRERWRSPDDILRRFPFADILPGNRAVFNIKGNTYRLIVKIHYNTGIVYIRFVGTHAEYDRIDAGTI